MHWASAFNRKECIRGGRSNPRRVFESLLTFLFWVCSQPIFRWAVEHFPVRITGESFEMARRGWKRMTRTTNRRGLAEVKFETTMESGHE